jgi:hypothetical protein
MGTLGNNWSAAEWQDMKDSWLGTRGYVDKQIIFRKFMSYDMRGNLSNTIETFRIAKYSQRSEHVWLSQVKVFDTVKGGYFTTGDLDIYSNFKMQGFTSGYKLPTGVVVKPYGGDEVIWNGKIWVIADQIEPVQFSYQAPQIWWRSVVRRADRSSQGNVVGP